MLDPDPYQMYTDPKPCPGTVALKPKMSDAPRPRLSKLVFFSLLSELIKVVVECYTSVLLI
jgi:hypothetical protein